VIGEELSEKEYEINMALIDSIDPMCFEEALKCAEWRQAMIGVKWIYKGCREN